LEKSISILAKATQVSDVAHGPLVVGIRLWVGESLPLWHCCVRGFDREILGIVGKVWLLSIHSRGRED
jgi:hypothetical protein